MYSTLVTIHNATAGLTLLSTLIAAGVLFVTAQTTGTWSALLLRATLILAALQGALGIVMLVVGQNFAYWFHYLLGVAAVGAVSVVVGRARRAPDREARRYGGILLSVFMLVLLAFLAGQYRGAIFA